MGNGNGGIFGKRDEPVKPDRESGEGQKSPVGVDEASKPADAPVDLGAVAHKPADGLTMDTGPKPGEQGFEQAIGADARRGVQGLREAEDQADQVGAQAPQVEMVSYTSGTTRNLKIGPFKFENGVLNLTPDKAAQLDKMLLTVDSRTRHTVKRLDLSAANKIGADFLKTRRVRGIDTSADRP